MRTDRRRVALHPRQGLRRPRLAGEALDPPGQRGSVVERCPVLPALAEGMGQIADGGTPQLDLDIVPRGA